MSDVTVGGTSGISNINLQSMDLETALMMVQTERTRLLDTQLASQIEAVQARNDQVAKLNNVLSALNKAVALFPSDANATKKLVDTGGWPTEKIQNIEVPINDALMAAGISDIGFHNHGGYRVSVSNPDGGTKTLPSGPGVMNGSVTKGELDAAITTIKGMIDSQSNSQQMDMLRLQSLSNKRNEAFDVMTNFVKKMQDSRSSIIGNMR